MTKLVYLLIGIASFNGVAKTSMEKVLDSEEPAHCKSELISLAEQTIGENKHRLLAIPTEKGKQNTFISGVIQYKDRQSHVVYAASKNTQGQCMATFQETFTIKSPCILVREEVFKKWQFQGKLNQSSMVLKNMRDKNMRAILSDASDGSYCLVSRHKNMV